MIKPTKHFNTAGPVNMKEHYKLNPLNRWDLNEVMDLINNKKYFLLHAPRQSGKTSCILALRDKINAENQYCCIYANIECARGAKNDIDEVTSAIIDEIGGRLEDILDIEDFVELADDMNVNVKATARVNRYLRKISKLINKPVILLIDEIDSLHGDAIVALLSQLRAGYDKRGESFPWSIMLTGVLDIKDYRLLNIDPKHITGGSCFNVKSKSLTIGNFSRHDIEKLYLEHTTETGQVFKHEVFDYVYEYTDGQPWLVNALAYESCFDMKNGFRDRSITITKNIMREAKKRLILSKQTHLDQLSEKLEQERVRNIIQPMIEGVNVNLNEQDIIYCRDLGLIKKVNGIYVIANKIYQEIIPRELTNSLQRRFCVEYQIPTWVNDDKSINIEKLLNLFVKFWRKNSEIWKDDVSGYTEVAPQLIFQAFLQRVGNGHGDIDREFALGTKRVDVYLEWFGGPKEQRVVFELKMRTENHNTDVSLEKIKNKGLVQTAEYADKCNATESHLLIFDRRENISWNEKIWNEVGISPCGSPYKIKIWGM